MCVRIVVDSAADLAPTLRQRLEIVPLTVCFGEQAYADGVDLTHHEFYEMLAENEVLPTTSQATPERFDAVYRQICKAGDQAVVITLSAALSGTCQSATLAAGAYPGQVFVVDSQNVSIGIGVLAEYALALADAGLTAEEIVARLEQVRGRVHLVALMDTLEYLKKGGRISKTTAVAGSLLNIKPVICVEDGELKIAGKARGIRQGIRLLTDRICTWEIDLKMPVLLGYTGLYDATLQTYLQSSSHLWHHNDREVQTTTVGSVVGVHAGPGAIAAAFFSPEKERK